MALGIIDLISPYFFAGFDLGPGIHDALDMLHVDEYETAWDEDAVVIWGISRIDTTNNRSSFFSPRAGGQSSQGSSASDENLQWDWHDVAVRFRITAARNEATSLLPGNVTKAGVSEVLQALDSGGIRSDYPNTQFRIELMFDLVSVTFPKLIGAKLDGYILVPDPDNKTVKISLPKILLILTQDSAADTNFDVNLGSFGASTFDDTDTSIGTMPFMTPPYALTGGQQFGFGFRKAILDLSHQNTPPDILDMFGVGEDWKGIYLPEVRLFVSTQKSAGVAFNVGAREMLIGLDPTPGLWGDFNFDVDVLGDQLIAGIRLFSVSGQLFEPELKHKTSDSDRYWIRVPSSSGPSTENYLLFIDIASGAAPFKITVVAGEDHPENLDEVPDDDFFNDDANRPEDISVLQRTRLFSQNERVAIRITSRNPLQRRVIILDIFPRHIVDKKPNPPKIPAAILTGSTEPADSNFTVSQDVTNDEILVIDDPAHAIVTVNGTAVNFENGRFTVPVEQGEDKDISVEWTVLGEEQIGRYKVFFDRGYPREGESDLHISGTEGDLEDLVDQFKLFTPAETLLRVDGYASYQHHRPNQHHLNNPLSQARAEYVVSELVRLGIPREDIDSVMHHSDDRHPGVISGDPLTDGQVPNNHSAEDEFKAGGEYDPKKYQVGQTTLQRPTENHFSYTGNLKRAALPPVEVTAPPKSDPPTPQAQHPNWLRHIGGSVRFERDAIPVAGELRLTVDFDTAHEEGLRKAREDVTNLPPGMEDPNEPKIRPGVPNPEDGVVEFRLAITYDKSSGTFTETFVAKAGSGDTDGLWSWGSIPTENSTDEPESNIWRDILGLYFTLAPLLSETAADTAAGGEIVPLAIGLATPVVISGLGIAHVLKFTHYGVEINVKHDEDEVSASLLFDVESSIWLNLKLGSFVIVTNRPDKPVKIRYKAVGFAFESNPNGPVRFRPIFDSSRGYTIDLADSGSLKVLPSLGDRFGDIIQVLGARIARTNPLNLEVELGMGVDMGVFSVDKFAFRLPIQPLGTPTITALAVGVHIKDVLEGTGYLEIKEDGFAGQLDLTLPSVGIRIAGGLAIRSVTEGSRSATATFVSLAVEFPSGIPLGGTGLAIFGFLGLFAMHHRRNENTTLRNPGLDWLVNKVQGDPTNVVGWVPKLDQWAFGVGVVAGTIEGATVLNVKGILVLELPGPRLLLFVKADILTKKPDTKGNPTGKLFAVVDVNPQRVLIGIQFSYKIERVLDLIVPVEAGFFYDPPEHFYVDAGTIDLPVTAKILELFNGTAYFMLHGDGIPNFPLGVLQGFSVAAGFQVSFIWGSTAARLYIKVAAGFDVGIGFNPLFFAGRIFLNGELRLFIVSIEAHGELSFRSDGRDTRIQGEVCGHVDFYFFSVGGCVKFAIGTEPGAPKVPDIIRDFMLQSRSYALIEGTGVDRGIDNILCHGTTDGAVPTIEVRENDGVVIVEAFVPIDSIPLVQFEVAPELAPAASIDGQLSSGLPPGFGGWQKRGQNYVKYEIKKIELKLISINGVNVAAGTSPVMEGPRPYTWRHPAQQAGSDGLPVELALLDWKPTNVDKALVQGPALDSLVDSRWGKICTPIAKAARVLWTFRNTPLGPSMDGWKLEGEMWPDAPGSYRSQPADKLIKIKEIWRTHSIIDGLLPTQDATVIGIPVRCPQSPRRPTDIHISLNDNIRLLSLTRAVPDNDQGIIPAAAISTVSRAAIVVPRRCIGKVLQAPYEVLFSALSSTNPFFQPFKELDEQRKELLRDVIKISGGPFLKTARLLIFARIKMIIEGLIKVRAFDKNGKLAGDVTAVFTIVSTAQPVPAKWTNQNGPWWDDVALARGAIEPLKRGGWAEYVVEIILPKPVTAIEIGVAPLSVAVNSFGMNPPSFYLAVIDAISESEIIREEDENNQNGDDVGGLEDALANTKHALLIPGARYEVAVTYDGSVGAKREKPEENQDPNEIVSLRSVSDVVSKRTFYTDNLPPRSLDPWTLSQYPSAAEQYHFYDDPVVIVFATDNVLELYKAYKKNLRAIAKAASFRGSVDTPEFEDLHFMLAEFFRPLETAILSPWQATVRRRLGQLPCGNFDPANDQHGRAVLPFKLDPLTDYILDIEMLTEDGRLFHIPGPGPQKPLFRSHFTTSRYASRESFAKDIRTTFIDDQIVNAPAALSALGNIVTDEVLDQALHESGIGVTERPKAAKVSVLWDNNVPARPVAIYIEAPEPLFRSRKCPEAQYDESGEYILSWKMKDQLWLYVDELVRATPNVLITDGSDFKRRETGTKNKDAVTLKDFRKKFIGPKTPELPPNPPPPASMVARFIHDVSGTRMIALLKPGVRGKTISLGLVRNLNPFLDTDITDTPIVLSEINLSTAPWEVII